MILVYFAFNQQVKEGQPAGAVLGTLQAKDPDEGENGTIVYSLSGTVYRISKNVKTLLFILYFY